MDPVGPWSAYAAASYNRLANATAVTAATASDYHHQLASVGVTHNSSHPVSSTVNATTTSPHQLLLQAAHASATGAVNSPSAFNPGRFLTSPHVGYDAVFSPLFHQKTHYNPSLNQRHSTLKQASGEGGESNIVAADVVGPYSAVHHQTLAAAAGALFDHQSASTSSPYQPTSAHTQLHSPFGILPHESVLSGGGSSTTKANGPAGLPFENAFVNHFTSGSESQQDTHIHNSSGVAERAFCGENSINAAAKKSNKTQNVSISKNTSVMPQSSVPTLVVKSVVGDSPYPASLAQQPCCQSHQHSTTTITATNNNSFVSAYEGINKSCLQISNNNSTISGTKKQTSLTPVIDRHVSPSELQHREKCAAGEQSSVQFTMSTMPQGDRSALSSYNSIRQSRNLPTNNVITVTPYHTPLRPTASAISYSPQQNSLPVKTPSSDMIDMSNSITQKSPDCGVVVPRRPSPLLAQSRSSPLANVPGPLYPIYNSPVLPINSSQAQQTTHPSSVSLHCPQQNYNTKQTGVEATTSQSPLDATIQRRSCGDQLSSAKNYILGTSDCIMTPRSWDPSSTDNDRMSNTRHKTGNRANIIYPPGYGIGSVVQKLHEQQLQQQQDQQLYFNYKAVSDRTTVVMSPNSDARKVISNSCTPASSASASPPSAIKSLKKSNERNNVSNRDTIQSNQISNLTRAPPPAHKNSVNQPPQFDNYYDYERWNLPGAVKVLNRSPAMTSDHSPGEPRRTDSGICNTGVNICNASTVITTCSSNINISTSSAMNDMRQSDHSQHLNLAPTFYHHPHLSSPLVSTGQIYTHPHHRLPSDIHSTLPSSIVECRPSDEAQNQAVKSASDSLSPSKVIADELTKVVVPNIEEELDFLNDSEPDSQKSCTTKASVRPESKTTPVTLNSSSGGFMASYLKFLQGERETSPPPSTRTVRRTPYTRVKCVTPAVTPTVTSSVSASSSNSTTTTSTAPVYNLEDDPRYFPLPKTSAHRGSLDSSDDENNDHGEFSCFKKKPVKEPVQAPAEKVTSVSSENIVNTKNQCKKSVNSSNKNIEQSTNKKRRPNISSDGSSKTAKKVKTERKKNEKQLKKSVKAKSCSVANKKQNQTKTKTNTKPGRKSSKAASLESVEDVIIPQRTIPKRKAKEQVFERSMRALVFDEDEENDFGDNDIEDEDFEPDWLPLDDDDDELYRFGRGSKRKKCKGLSTRSSANSKKSVAVRNRKSKRVKTSVDPLAVSEDSSQKDDSLEEINADAMNGYVSVVESNGNFKCPFAVGEFLVSKNDLIEEWPPIWRVDGKSLLHKFMPFEQNGETLYKCVPTYSSCEKQNIASFKTVPTRIRQRSKTKTDVVVELLRSEMVLSLDEQQIVDAAMKESSKYQDNFEVYIQTLLSQALDSNFLAEIIQEKDEYFLINMKAIDDFTETHRMRMVKALNWETRSLERSLYTWPCYNITYNVTEVEEDTTCESCDSVDTMNRVVVYGRPYCIKSLEGRPPDKDVGTKEMLVCRNCLSSVSLYSKICHQKYLMFIECGKRVAEKRTTNPDKDTTVILNELLADEAWLQHLFNKVCMSWAQVDRLEKSKKS